MDPSDERFHVAGQARPARRQIGEGTCFALPRTRSGASRIAAFYDVTRMVELLPKRGLTTLLEVEPNV